MSTQAHLLAIGRFSPAIKNFLDYSGGSYNNTVDSSIVTTVLFQCNTSYQAANLAGMLNVEQWNFNTYYKTNRFAKIDVRLAVESFGNYDIDKFTRLQQAGFDFIYMLDT